MSGPLLGRVLLFVDSRKRALNLPVLVGRLREVKVYSEFTSELLKGIFQC